MRLILDLPIVGTFLTVVHARFFRRTKYILNVLACGKLVLFEYYVSIF